MNLRDEEPVLVVVEATSPGTERHTVRCLARRLDARGQGSAWRGHATSNTSWWSLDPNGEGVQWARGWETAEANALRTACVLS